MSEATVDFLVIGAQKSGTTALFRYMQGHPKLYLPPQKEINFFANEERFGKGLAWYMETYFAGADEQKLWGEVSPHYMGYRCAPARIHHALPQAKLIVLLRNPVDRAYSHYRMAVRRDEENRPFSEAIADQSRAFFELPETEGYGDSDYAIAFSRYGTILESYLRRFDRGQVLVLFQEDLLVAPRERLRETFSFLDVDSAYVPPNLGKKYHLGGIKRSKRLEQWIENRTTSKRLVKAVVGSKNVETAKFWFHQMNVRPVENDGPSSDDRERLRRVLYDDVSLLKELIHRSTPWPEFEQPLRG